MKHLTSVTIVLVLTTVVIACQEKPSPERLRAEELTSEGIELYRHERPCGERPVWEQAVDIFEQAIAADSTYALAHAYIAVPYLMNGDEQKARAAAEKAMALDPNLADAHLADGVMKYYYTSDFEAAETAFKRALELDPEHSEAHREYAGMLNHSGRSDEALMEARRAIDIDPQAPEAYITLAAVQRYMGNLDEAVEMAQESIELNPGTTGLHAEITTIHLARGEYDEAIALVDKGLECNSDDPTLIFYKAWAHTMKGDYNEALTGFEKAGDPRWSVWVKALMGSRDEALAGIDTLKENMEQGVWSLAWPIADTYHALGEKEEALVWYEKAYESRVDRLSALLSYGWWLKNAQHYAPIRDEPRIQAIIEKAGY